MRRERTNTPLQALVTLNDPQFVEAAKVLAEDAWIKTNGKQETDARRDRFASALETIASRRETDH